MMGSADVFAEIPDPRTGNAKRHDLLKTLTIDADHDRKDNAPETLSTL